MKKKILITLLLIVVMVMGSSYEAFAASVNDTSNVPEVSETASAASVSSPLYTRGKYGSTTKIKVESNRVYLSSVTVGGTSRTGYYNLVEVTTNQLSPQDYPTTYLTCETTGGVRFTLVFKRVSMLDKTRNYIVANSVKYYWMSDL